MGRPARQDIEGGWHHVMNRGADRGRIFFTRGDGEAFERLLARGSDLFGVEVHAYCLMPTLRVSDTPLSLSRYLVGD